MALTIQNQISQQETTPTTTYCYLYEPLVVVVSESNQNAKKVFVDLEVVDTKDSTNIIETLLIYAEFDLNPGVDLTFDLMDLARQHHNANIYKNAKLSDITNQILNDGFKQTVSEFKYNFKIYTDVSARQTVSKLPIIGGRMLEQFNATVGSSQALNEFVYYGLNITDLEDKWGNTFLPRVTLVDPTLQDSRPTITSYTTPNCEPIAWIIWKSRFGGWMWWGFELKNRAFSKNYEGNLDVGMFESTKDSGGDVYIPVNYTGINTSYSITLKSLSLSSQELLAVAGINASPAVYFMNPGETKMELMRLSSASTPIDSKADGGDFSITLQSISKTSQKTI